MKNGQNVNIQIEYGTENLKEILIELLKEQYINYITMNEKKCLFKADNYKRTSYNLGML